MAEKGWTARVATAAAAAAGTGAAQLGLGYGLGVVVWPAETPDDSIWLGSLGWATWITASATVFGAVLAARLGGAPASRPHGGPAPRLHGSWRLALAASAAVGALIAVVLIALPARMALRTDTHPPEVIAGGYALLGVVLGLVVAYWAVVSRPIAANLLATGVWLWALAIAAIVVDLTLHRTAATYLTSWQFTELTHGRTFGTIFWPSALLTLAAAFLIGLLAAAPAARRGDLGLGTAASGTVGPLVVAIAFLALAPQLPDMLGPLESAYLIAPYAVLAGLAGSAIAVTAGRAAEASRARRTAGTDARQAADTDTISPAQESPAGRVSTAASGQSTGHAAIPAQTRPTSRPGVFGRLRQSGREGRNDPTDEDDLGTGGPAAGRAEHGGRARPANKAEGTDQAGRTRSIGRARPVSDEASRTTEVGRARPVSDPTDEAGRTTDVVGRARPVSGTDRVDETGRTGNVGRTGAGREVAGADEVGRTEGEPAEAEPAAEAARARPGLLGRLGLTGRASKTERTGEPDPAAVPAGSAAPSPEAAVASRATATPTSDQADPPASSSGKSDKGDDQAITNARPSESNRPDASDRAIGSGPLARSNQPASDSQLTSRDQPDRNGESVSRDQPAGDGAPTQSGTSRSSTSRTGTPRTGTPRGGTSAQVSGAKGGVDPEVAAAARPTRERAKKAAPARKATSQPSRSTVTPPPADPTVAQINPKPPTDS